MFDDHRPHDLDSADNHPSGEHAQRKCTPCEEGWIAAGIHVKLEEAESPHKHTRHACVCEEVPKRSMQWSVPSLQLPKKGKL